MSFLWGVLRDQPNLCNNSSLVGKDADSRYYQLPFGYILGCFLDVLSLCSLDSKLNPPPHDFEGLAF